MPRVLVVCEGPHEEAALHKLVDRLAAPHHFAFDWRRVSDAALIVAAGSGGPLYKRAMAWIRYAMRERFDAVVLVIDHDGFDDRVEPLTRAQNEQDPAVGFFPRA